MTKHLRCFFDVINENESRVLIIGSILKSFSLWQWVIQIGLLRSDAQLMIWFSTGVPRCDLAFLDAILHGVREEKLQLRDLWIFLKHTITWLRDFRMFFIIAYFILTESNSSVKNCFHIRWLRLSLLWGGIFSNVVICLLNTSTEQVWRQALHM